MELPCVTGVSFRLLPSIEGYAIGDDGSVWTRWHRVGSPTGKGGSMLVIRDSWRRRKTTPMGPRRNEVITISYGGQARLMYVHRLVLEAFVGPCPEGMECCHNDGNTSNNTLNNLRWDTPKANMADRDLHGKTVRGTRSVLAKLDDTKVREIRRRLDAGTDSQLKLASEFGVSPSLIRAVMQRKVWKHVK